MARSTWLSKNIRYKCLFLPRAIGTPPEPEMNFTNVILNFPQCWINSSNWNHSSNVSAYSISYQMLPLRVIFESVRGSWLDPAICVELHYHALICGCPAVCVELHYHWYVDVVTILNYRWDGNKNHNSFVKNRYRNFLETLIAGLLCLKVSCLSWSFTFDVVLWKSFNWSLTDGWESV